MQVTFEIDNEMINKMCQGEIENIPKEKIHEIIFQALKTHLNDTEGKTLFRKKQNDDCSCCTYVVGDLLEKLIKNIDIEKETKEYKSLIWKMVEKDHKELFIAAMSKIFIDVLFHNSYDFQQKFQWMFMENLKNIQKT